MPIWVLLYMKIIFGFTKSNIWEKCILGCYVIMCLRLRYL